MDARAMALHDAALALAPEGVEHDAGSCPYCTEKASASDSPPVSRDRSERAPEAAAEGGRTVSDTLTQDTHQALLDQAVRQATEQTERDLIAARERIEALTGERDGAIEELATLKEEHDRISGELDLAQVELKKATDEVAQLKTDIADRDQAARRAEVAAERAAQVRELGLFSEDYITEKASRWAEVEAEAWADRLDEWKQLKASGPTAAPTETASAMSGTKPPTTTKPRSARRAVLALPDPE